LTYFSINISMTANKINLCGNRCIMTRVPPGEVHVEMWESICLWHYLDEVGHHPSNEEIKDEDFWFATLFDAIEYYKERDGWDFYIYVPPEECGEPYGMTIWYSLLG